MADNAEERGDAGTLAVLHAMLTTFTGVLDGMERRLGTIESTLQSLQTDQDSAGELREALRRLERVEAIETDLAEIRAALVDHPAATIHDAVARLTRQVDSLVAQPGPGPALAMVAAGLSERFEQRTEGLIGLLQEHAELMHALTEQVEAAMHGLVAAVEGRQAGLDALLVEVRAVGHAIERMGVRVEETRDRFDAVFGAGEDLRAAVGAVRTSQEAMDEAARLIEAHDVPGLARAVRDESELLAQRISAVSVSIDSVRALLVDHVEDTAHSLGRKASEAGRRLASDLGLVPRGRERAQRPEPPPKR